MKASAIIAQQRTGTALLTRMLGSHPRIAAVAEIFHDAAPDQESYFSFLLRSATLNPALALPNARAGLLIDFLKSISDRAEREHVVFNAKYNSLHHLESYWQRLDRVPRFFEVCHDSGIKIIHLKRANSLLTAISSFRAEATGVWHVDATDNVVASVFSIRPEALIARIEVCENVRDEVDKSLQGIPSETVWYEDISPDGKTISAQVTERLAKFLAVEDLFDRRCRVRKIATDWKSEILNWPDIEAEVRKTRFASYLD